MAERHRCIVPFCTATTGKFGEEWICSKHWRITPKAEKAELRRIAREYRKAFGNAGYWTFDAGSEKRLASVEADRAWRAAWDSCKDAAVCASMAAML